MSDFPADPEGCYICQPDNPNAAEEGCRSCDQEYWAATLKRQSLERSGGGTSRTQFILASMNSVPPLSDAEQDALIEWLNSTGGVRKAMTAGVLADLYRVAAAIAHLRCECKTTAEAL